MEKENKFWLVRDKRRLLLVMMEKLAGGAHISFEGDLSALRLSSIPGALQEETDALKRNTLLPKQDFIVLPLESTTSKTIVSAIGGTVPNTILHIQIEKGGSIQFAAYDNFHPECIVFNQMTDKSILESLVSKGILRPYTKRSPPALGCRFHLSD
jgi:hypothetical protein